MLMVSVDDGGRVVKLLQRPANDSNWTDQRPSQLPKRIQSRVHSSSCPCCCLSHAQPNHSTHTTKHKKKFELRKDFDECQCWPPQKNSCDGQSLNTSFPYDSAQPFHLAEIRGATEVSRYWSWINKTKRGKKEFNFFFQIKEKIKMGKCGISRSANDDFLSLCASVGRNIRLENSGMKGKKQKKKPGTEARFHYPRWSSIREP